MRRTRKIHKKHYIYTENKTSKYVQRDRRKDARIAIFSNETRQ